MQGNLTGAPVAQEGGAAALRSGQLLVADLMKEVTALKAQLEIKTASLDEEKRTTLRLDGEVAEMQSQLETFKSMDDPAGDDLFDDDDDLDDLDAEDGGASEKIVAAMSAEGRGLVDKLRRENMASHFEVVTLSEQLQGLGEVPSSTSGMTKAGELARLRKRNHDLEDQLSSLSGDVVPLAIVNRIKEEKHRQVEELRAELAEATASVVAAAEETDYANLDLLEAKVVMYRQLLVEAVRGELGDDVIAEIERIASEPIPNQA
jgi:hypothetical protein